MHLIVEIQIWYQRNGFASAQAAGVGGRVVDTGLSLCLGSGVERDAERPDGLVTFLRPPGRIVTARSTSTRRIV